MGAENSNYHEPSNAATAIQTRASEPAHSKRKGRSTKGQSSQDTNPLTLPDEDGRCNGVEYPETPNHIGNDIDAPSETIAVTISLSGSAPFQFNPCRTAGLQSSLFVASQETVHVN